MKAAMAERGPGERAERARRSRKLLVGGVLAVSGFVPGLLVGMTDTHTLLEGGTWSPAAAIGLAVGFLTAVGFGSWVLWRQTDEYHRAGQYKAVALAGAFYMIAYPVWFFLWKGGLAGEPLHWALFLGFYLALLVGLLAYRPR
jgi:hypothetical protein